MKKFLSILLLMVLMIPMVVKAEDKEEVEATDREPVPVYIFRSNTCGYCKALMEWINSDEIQEEFGKYFKVVDFEVSTSQENAELMQKAKDYFKVDGQGVPYIVVGTYDYPQGFAADYVVDEEKGTTMGEQLLAQIIETYTKDEKDRFDILKELEYTPNKKKDNSLAVGIISGIVILTMVGGIIVARKNS